MIPALHPELATRPGAETKHAWRSASTTPYRLAPRRISANALACASPTRVQRQSRSTATKINAGESKIRSTPNVSCYPVHADPRRSEVTAVLLLRTAPRLASATIVLSKMRPFARSIRVRTTCRRSRRCAVAVSASSRPNQRPSPSRKSNSHHRSGTRDVVARPGYEWLPRDRRPVASPSERYASRTAVRFTFKAMAGGFVDDRHNIVSVITELLQNARNGFRRQQGRDVV